MSYKLPNEQEDWLFRKEIFLILFDKTTQLFVEQGSYLAKLKSSVLLESGQKLPRVKYF